MKKQKTIKAWAVYGQWGYIGAWKYKFRAKEEAERLRKNGFAASIEKAEIKILEK